MSILDLLIMAKTRPRPENPPYFVSTQVAEARRYFLDLTRRPALDSSLCAAVANECGRTTWSTGAASLSLSWSFVAEGAGSVELSGRRYRLQAGVTFAYGPGVPHTIRTDPDRPMLKYYLVFKGVEGKRLLDESPLHGWLAVQISSPKEVVELLEILQREGAGQGGYGARICAALVPALIMKISERVVPDAIHESRALTTFLRAKRWMERHYLHLKTVEQAAEACHVEVTYLSRLFQRFAHTTPHRFLMRLKMNRATELLLDGDLLVKEVAARLEFADAFHFSRVFKRLYGLPPQRFIRHGAER